MSSEVQEKDNFWLYVAVGVIAFAGTIFMVKQSESDKYKKAESLIAEDSSNSAYLKK